MGLADHISLFVEGMFDFPRPKTLPTFVKYFLHEGTKFIIVELIPFSSGTVQFMMIVCYVIRFIRLKYADKAHPEKGVMIAPVPGNYLNTVSSKAKYDVSFVAKVISDKYENAIPLERQSTMLAREGINVNSSTMGFLAEQAADRLKPLFELMGKQTMDCDVLHVDETSFKLQEKGRKNCRSVWMWCRVTEVGPPMVVFHFAKISIKTNSSRNPWSVSRHHHS